MKRKTAIEQCIEWAEGGLAPASHDLPIEEWIAKTKRARAEFRALLLAADVLDRHDTGLEPEVDVALARLRRLGVLPEVRRG